MSIPTEILRFFHFTGQPENKARTVRECLDFITEGKKLDVLEVLSILQKFKNLGRLVELHTLVSDDQRAKIDSELLRQILACFDFDENAAKYGTYDFMIYGFPAIISKFSESVFPVIIEKPDGSPDIGTAFLLGNQVSLVTAKHVIQNAINIKIMTTSGKLLRCKSVRVPKDAAVDLALIHIEPGLTNNLSALRAENGNILDEILTIGYPPIPGFDAVQIFDIAAINSKIRYSAGTIVGQKESYLDSMEYLLINARVKGGNSGGPVINKQGNLVGVVTDIPFDTIQKDKIDHLGYGIITPAAQILKLLANLDNLTTLLPVINSAHGFSLDT